MSKFPLYDSMIKGTAKTDLTIKNKQEFNTLIDQMDRYGQELVYALIRMYQLENEETEEIGKIPYFGKTVGVDVEFDLENFPNKLKHLLFKFLKVHIEKMKDDSKKC
jgi:hypothetical protein